MGLCSRSYPVPSATNGFGGGASAWSVARRRTNTLIMNCRREEDLLDGRVRASARFDGRLFEAPDEPSDRLLDALGVDAKGHQGAASSDLRRTALEFHGLRDSLQPRV